MAKPTPLPHTAIAEGFLAQAAERNLPPFDDFEDYVEQLCRYITAEIRANRIEWDYELPTAPKLKGFFNKFNVARANARIEK